MNKLDIDFGTVGGPGADTECASLSVVGEVTNIHLTGS